MRVVTIASALGVLAVIGCSVSIASHLPAQQSTGAQPTATPAALVFEGATVVDMKDGRLLAKQTVVVVGHRVQAVGPTGKIRVPKDAQVVDARGKYLIPGLWDMHIHPGYYAHIAYPLLIANGVTGIRDAGTSVPLDSLVRWRQDVTAGLRVGPRVVNTGPSLDTKQPSLEPCRRLCNGRPIELKVTTPAEGRRLVDSLKQAGADMIKLHGEELARDIYFAVAAEARRLGIPFGGHLPYAVTAAEASDSGHRIIDHIDSNRGLKGSLRNFCWGDSATVEKCTAMATRFTRNGTWLVPTLTVVNFIRALPPYARELVRYWPDSVRRASLFAKGTGLFYPVARLASDRSFLIGDLQMMRQSGMPLLAGTDASTLWPEIAPGFSLHDELELLVWAGLTPLGALQAATLNPAKLFNATDSLGDVAPGNVADLVLLDADPLTDIRNTRKISAVVTNGRYFDRPALDALLAEVERRAR